MNINIEELAYLIFDYRLKNGIAGSSESDWFQAETMIGSGNVTRNNVLSRIRNVFDAETGTKTQAAG